MEMKPCCNVAQSLPGKEMGSHRSQGVSGIKCCLENVIPFPGQKLGRSQDRNPGPTPELSLGPSLGFRAIG